MGYILHFIILLIYFVKDNTKHRQHQACENAYTFAVVYWMILNIATIIRRMES